MKYVLRSDQEDDLISQDLLKLFATKQVFNISGDNYFLNHEKLVCSS